MGYQRSASAAQEQHRAAIQNDWFMNAFEEMVGGFDPTLSACLSSSSLRALNPQPGAPPSRLFGIRGLSLWACSVSLKFRLTQMMVV